MDTGTPAHFKWLNALRCSSRLSQIKLTLYTAPLLRSPRNLGCWKLSPGWEGSLKRVARKNWGHLWCGLVEISGVSLPNEEALHALIDVHSLFWYFGPGCRLLTPWQTRRQTFCCGAVNLQSTSYSVFTTSARALCPAATVSWLGVCLYVQIRELLCATRWNSCPGACYHPVPQLTVSSVVLIQPFLACACKLGDQTVFEKGNPPEERGQVYRILPGAVILMHLQGAELQQGSWTT